MVRGWGAGRKLEGGSGGREGPVCLATEDETLNGIEERDRILKEGNYEVFATRGTNVKKRPAAARDPEQPAQELASYRQQLAFSFKKFYGEVIFRFPILGSF